MQPEQPQTDRFTTQTLFYHPHASYPGHIPPTLEEALRDAETTSPLHAAASQVSGTFKHPPMSGYTYGRYPNTLERLESTPLATERAINVYYPFSSKQDWDLGKFLIRNMNQTQIDEFLKLAWTREHHHSPSFRSSLALRSWIESLPNGPQWRLDEITVNSYRTKKPIRLLWRDGLEVVEHLFGHPAFSHHMSFDPVQETATSSAGVQSQVFTEYGSGMHAWNCQATLPNGATLVGIIAASDKTQVTMGTGGLEMHPLFITISNIHSTVRQKASAHAWICAAFIPIPKFEDIHSDYQGVLAARVWHQCLDIVMASLKDTASVGRLCADPDGQLRHIFTPLVAYTADLPEQQLIACVSKNASPVTTAVTQNFGDPAPQTPQYGHGTLKDIAEVCKGADPWDFVEFLPRAKAKNLSGVNLPFWRDWKLSDPTLFLPPDILHFGHKFFFDHVLSWCKHVVGSEELDRRFKCLHKWIGYRHFASGVSHVKQMTGREHRNIQ